MMNKNQEKLAFYFDVEIKKRELFSRLTVAALLAERGHHVFIGRYVNSMKKIIPKATIVKKSVRFKNITNVNDLINSGYKIVNMEEVSTTHYKNDSVYNDQKINKLKLSQRKTIVKNWGRYELAGEISNE